MGAIVLALTWACATGIITTASRMTWSFARDKGTPFSKYLNYVSPHNRIPLVALGVSTGLACLLNLIYIGSYTAFNGVVSLTITGFYSSYLLPAAFLLYHRIKGNIAPHSKMAEDTPGISPPLDEEILAPAEKVASTEKQAIPEEPSLAGHAAFSSDRTRRPSQIAQAPLTWGPWHLPGWFGIINNAYACTYMVFVIFWSVWPPGTPVDASTMNYSVVVTVGVIVFSIVWYYIRGREEYKGPTIDKEVASIMRLGSIVTV